MSANACSDSSSGPEQQDLLKNDNKVSAFSGPTLLNADASLFEIGHEFVQQSKITRFNFELQFAISIIQFSELNAFTFTHHRCNLSQYFDKLTILGTAFAVF